MEGAQKAAAKPKPDGHGYVIEWAVRFNRWFLLNWLAEATRQSWPGFFEAINSDFVLVK